MYVAPEHSVSDPEPLRRLVRDYPFATLHSAGPAGQLASHLPIVVDPDAPEPAVDTVVTQLVGHMGVANEHWRHLPPDSRVLTIFSGPHAYISPTWYGPGPQVPTWNYTAVHLHGRLTIARDPDDAMRILAATVVVTEAGRRPEWDPSDSREMHRKKLSGIRAFRIEIDRHEAIFKLSGNKPLDVQQSVRAGLAASTTGADRDLAAFMDREVPLA